MNIFIQTLMSGLISGSVISGLIGLLLYRRTKQIEAEVKHHFEQQFALFKSQRQWEEQSVAELLGPLYMQFDRTKRASNRWDRKNLYLEANIILEGNRVIRDLLLTKGHLIPPHLLEHAGKLIDHYDGWIEEFDRVRVKKEAGEDVTFVFTYDFPRESETKFREAFRDLRDSLYRTNQANTLD
ncbi:MAG: hypothetical protein EOM08_14300 [Clostridia bacterium]|nr:hypothetical protein [Clostridia bacterium]